jgi:hypothetical protein
MSLSIKPNIRKGQTVTCKYPKHGTRNILKLHSGVVESLGCTHNGVYATIRSDNGQVRSLSLEKMIDLTVG